MLQPFTSFDGFWGAHCGLPRPPASPLGAPDTLPPLPPGMEGLPLKQLGVMTAEEELSNAQLEFHVSAGGVVVVAGCLSACAQHALSMLPTCSRTLPGSGGCRLPGCCPALPSRRRWRRLAPTGWPQWHPGSAGAHRLLEDFVRGGRLRAFDKERAKVRAATGGGSYIAL